MCIPAIASANLERTEAHETGPAGERSKIEWKRDGRIILTQTIPQALDSDSLCMISIGISKRDVVIYITKGRASAISTTTPGFLIALDDFTKDGNPDFLQIKNADSKKVIEAFSIINGIVTPLPDDKFRKDRMEFYFDEDIIEYLNKNGA